MDVNFIRGAGGGGGGGAQEKAWYGGVYVGKLSFFCKIIFYYKNPREKDRIPEHFC